MEENKSGLAFDKPPNIGSTRAGSGDWSMQRVTSVALVPLTLWIAASLFARARSDYASVILWLRTPWATVMMVFLLIALFYHIALGLQVVVEDYVHNERIKMLSMVVIRLGCFTFATVGIIATIYIAFG